MNAMLSASVLAALLTLAGQAGAQTVLKPSVNAKPGTGRTANVIMTDSGPAPCPKGPAGADACTVNVTGERSGGGGGGDLPKYDPGRDSGGAGDATAAIYSKEAEEIANGLVLPCPKENELDEAYIARMTQYCQTTVKKAFSSWVTWFRPSLPKEACLLADISGKATMVLAGALECKQE